MKLRSLLAVLLLLPSLSFAGDVGPKSFTAQYILQSITDDPMINFNISVNASAFPSMDFSQLNASVVMVNGNAEIAPSKLVYSKSPATIIAGSQAFIFSFEKVDALKILGNLKSSRLLFTADNGSSFSINIQTICNTAPGSFFDLYTGHTGCDVDQEVLADLIQKEEDKANGKPIEYGVCEDDQDLLNLKEIACGSEKILKKVEELSKCRFSCNE